MKCACRSGKQCWAHSPDPRDATIAALKAEVERLTSKHAAWSANKERRHGEEKQLLRDDLARHQRALAAGPAALRGMRSGRDDESNWTTVYVAIETVEQAQRRAMEEE